MDFIDDTTFFSNFDELSIIDAIPFEKFRHDEGVVVIAIRKYFETVGECWQLDTFGKINKHATASGLRPFTDGKTRKEVGLTLYAGVAPLFTLLKPLAA